MKRLLRISRSPRQPPAAARSLASSTSSPVSAPSSPTRTRLRRRVVVPLAPFSLDRDGGTRQAKPGPSASWTVPLTLADYHLRHEQLPFCFLFRETLDAQKLEESLRRVLRHFPVLGGQLSADHLSIQCQATGNDSVPWSIADRSGSLSDWLSATAPHNHTHTSGGGHPALLDVFDSLFGTEADAGHRGANAGTADSLLAVRVTYFSCGGTALGINWSHVLGDTASLLRFVECWGHEYLNRHYDASVCHVRANAACAGMSQHFAHVLLMDDVMPKEVVPDSARSFLSQCLDHFYAFEGPDRDVTTSALPTPTIPHQYVHLPFPDAVLEAMKAYGMSVVSSHSAANDCQTEQQTYVSTNDMLTSFGWLLKRSLSGRFDHGISMVVNLRGRCGVAAFGDVGASAAAESTSNAGVPRGLLGNAITNVVARFPATDINFGMDCTARAALAIRLALGDQLAEVPHRIEQSRQGRPLPAVSSAESFATTSWSQFSLQTVRFGTEPLAGFHGHPSHPLPAGSTFSSVIGPAWPGCEPGGGRTYKLLLPSHQAEDARRIHSQLSQAFLQWHANKRK